MAKKRKLENTICQKNDILTLEIDNMGNEGEGVAHLEGYTLFVKDALVGDVIRGKVMKTRKHFGYVRLMEIITPSPFRVEPECPVARQCGGCQLQHCSYVKQLEWKEEKIADCLRRIGGQNVVTSREMGSGKNSTHSEERTEEFFEIEKDNQNGKRFVMMEPILGMENPRYYRNKAQFPVGMNKEGRLTAGFYAGRTHQIIENTDCMIQHPCSKILVETVLDFMEKWHIPVYDEATHKGLVRHILIRVGVFTGEVMLCLVINGKKLPYQDKLVEMLLSQDFGGKQNVDLSQKKDRSTLYMASICLNHNTEKTNSILGQKVSVLYGRKYIEDSIGDITYRISPLSFYQVNPEQTKKLYDTALEYAALTGDEVVWDLYCGIGTISLFLAQRAKKVCGVEIVPQAIENARENAQINHIDNVEFFLGAAEDVVPAQYQESGGTLRADVVVVDPPRKGCDEKLLRTVVRMEPERIVYVSCDPATLARDVKYLCRNGYELRRVRGCDMFGMGYHVETVVILSHKKTDSVINVKVEFGEGEGKVPLDNIAKRAAAYKPKEQVTYKMIKEYIEAKYGFKVHTAHIAEVKRDLGLPMYDAPNAVEELKQPRKHPMAEKVEAIKDAIIHFGIIDSEKTMEGGLPCDEKFR